MNSIVKFLKLLINIYTIAIVVTYYFFGTVPAAITLVSLISLKLISETVNIKIDTLKWFTRIPLIGSKISYIQNLVSSSDELNAKFSQFYADSEDPLLRGDLKDYAKERWPEKEYPILWMPIPTDLRRPTIRVGRLPDGSAPADTLCATAIDNKFVSDNLKNSLIVSLIVFTVTLIAWRPDMYFADPIINGAKIVNESGSSKNKSLSADAWSVEEMHHLESDSGSIAESAESVRGKFLKYVVASHGILTAFSFSFLVLIMSFRSKIGAAVYMRGQAISQIGAKEAITLWKRQIEKQALEETAYLGQLKTINEFDDSKTITIGKATGTLKFRNVLTAPERGNNVKMSLMDMSQNTLVIGGTGEGKTLFVLKPIIKQILNMVQNEGLKCGIYATDGKAVLWKDIKELAEQAGLGEKVIVIGCEPGQYGVDICDGMQPALIGDTITSILAQSSGTNASGDFWENMGSQLIKNAATVARAWEMTVAGAALVAETGDRLYSLSYINKLCTDQKLVEQAVFDIRSEGPETNPFGTQDLFDAMTYMVETWPAITEVTASGIRANVMNALGGFTFNVDLQRQFSSGSAKEVVNLKDCWGKIVLINIPVLEYGTAGRLINIMLKTKQFAVARERELEAKKMTTEAIEEKLEKIKNNPYLTQERKQELSAVVNLKDRCVFVADEYQDLITSSNASLSDATFWNVSRSTGMIGLIATQSISTLEQTIGKAATDNFILQMRSFIALRIEDPATIDYIKRLAGKSYRWNVPKVEQYETWEAYKREIKKAIIEFKPIRFSSAIKSGLAEAMLLKGIQTTFGYNHGYQVDERFLGKMSTSSNSDGGISRSNDAGELERAVWRRDDKAEAYMLSMEEHDAIDDDDLIIMARGKCFVHIQRGGGARQDFVELSTF